MICLCGIVFDKIASNMRKSKAIYAKGSFLSPDLELNGEYIKIKNKGLNKILNASVNIPPYNVNIKKFKCSLFGGELEFCYLTRNNNMSKIFKFIFNSKEKIHFTLIVNEIKSYYREIKGTCPQCINIWFFNKNDEKNEQLKISKNSLKSLYGLFFFMPLALMPDAEIKELKRCPKCGSRAVTINEVINKT
jgi:hypothetical protein